MMLIKIFELDKVDPRVYMIIVLVITTLIVRVIADAWIKDINKLMTPAAQLIGNIVGMEIVAEFIWFIYGMKFNIIEEWDSVWVCSALIQIVLGLLMCYIVDKIEKLLR